MAPAPLHIFPLPATVEFFAPFVLEFAK